MNEYFLRYQKNINDFLNILQKIFYFEYRFNAIQILFSQNFPMKFSLFNNYFLFF